MARTQGSHSDITGPRIREAALRLFAQHGFAAVSMRQIAADVGVQAGALYNYTSDKQSLLFSLMQGHMSDLIEAWKSQPTTDNAVSELERFVRFHIRYHMERPDAVFIAYMELRNLTAENFATIEAMRGSYENALETVLKQGWTEGVFKIRETKTPTRAGMAMLKGDGKGPGLNPGPT